jgi:hypothetical protein
MQYIGILRIGDPCIPRRAYGPYFARDCTLHANLYRNYCTFVLGRQYATFWPAEIACRLRPLPFTIT